jgi:hypothetical protein
MIVKNLQDVKGITRRREATFDIDVYFIGIVIFNTLNTLNKINFFIFNKKKTIFLTKCTN